MAVYHDARCRMCRRAGMKLFLKGARCHTDKCAIERRGYAPGEHGKSRRIKETNYGIQLREKSRKLVPILTTLEARKGQGAPAWLELDTNTLTARVLSIPTRDSIPIPINEQLIVELYSK